MRICDVCVRAVLILLVIVVSHTFSSCKKDVPPPVGNDDLLDTLRSNAEGPCIVREEEGVVRSLRCTIPVEGATAEAQARGFLSAYAPLFGLSDGESELGLVESTSYGGGREVVVFERRVGDYSVFGSDLRFHIRDGRIIYVSANLPAEVDVPEEASVDSDAAVEAAATALTGSPDGATAGDTELVVFNLGLITGEATGSQLTWLMTTVDDVSGVGRVAFVDATSGELIWSTTEGRTLDVYSANNNTNCTDIEGGDRTLWFDDSGLVEGVSPSEEGLEEGQEAYDIAHQVLDYWSQTFDRDGMWDDPGPDPDVYVHFDVTSDNAMYYRGALWFMDDFVALDIFAHEFTHGVNETEVDLVYALESGAIDESFADIFASFVDVDNWSIGEDTGPGAIRNVADPTGETSWCGADCDDVALPDHNNDKEELGVAGDCVESVECSDFQSCTQPDGSCVAGCVPAACIGGRCIELPDDCFNDLGYVHYNCSIPSYAAYLLIEGGIEADPATERQARPGIGTIKAEQIYYEVLTGGYLGSTTDFSALRDAMVLACLAFVEGKSIRGSDTYGVTHQDCGVVINAFATVGIGAWDTDYDSIDDGVPDNCRTTSNPEQEDEDNDDVGDVCDDVVAETGSLRVEVDEFRHFMTVSEALVELLDGGAIVASDTSNSAGQVVFEDVVTGLYMVRVSKEEYETTEVPVEVPPIIETNLIFELQRSIQPCDRERLICPDTFTDRNGHERFLIEDYFRACPTGYGTATAVCFYSTLDFTTNENVTFTARFQEDRSGILACLNEEEEPNPTEHFSSVTTRARIEFNGGYDENEIEDPQRREFAFELLGQVEPWAVPCDRIECPETFADSNGSYSLEPDWPEHTIPHVASSLDRTQASCNYEGGTFVLSWAQEEGESVPCRTEPYGGYIGNGAVQAQVLVPTIGDEQVDGERYAFAHTLIPQAEARALPCP